MLESARDFNYKSDQAGKIIKERYIEWKKAPNITRQDQVTELVKADAQGLKRENWLEGRWIYKDVYEKILGEIQAQYGIIKMSIKVQISEKER